jgi:hypothetical protein
MATDLVTGRCGGAPGGYRTGVSGTPRGVLFALAEGVARVRRARALHPAGRSFAGTLRIWGTGEQLGVPLFDEPGEYPATVRLSRGAGTPAGWPDVLGLAVRVTGRYPADLLLSSCGRSALARHVPRPARRFDTRYGSLAGYADRTGGRAYLSALATGARLGPDLSAVARTVSTGGVGFRLFLAVGFGPERPVGALALVRPLPAHVDAELAFDPVGRAPVGLALTGPLGAVRDATYAGSRRGRGVPGPR